MAGPRHQASQVVLGALERGEQRCRARRLLAQPRRGVRQRVERFGTGQKVARPTRADLEPQPAGAQQVLAIRQTAGGLHRVGHVLVPEARLIEIGRVVGQVEGRQVVPGAQAEDAATPGNAGVQRIALDGALAAPPAGKHQTHHEDHRPVGLVDHAGRVAAVPAEYRLAHRTGAGPVGEGDRTGPELEGDLVLVTGGIHEAWIKVGAERDFAAVEVHGLLEFGQHDGLPDSLDVGHQEAVMAARVGAQNRRGGIAAHAVGQQPFARQCAVEVGQVTSAEGDTRWIQRDSPLPLGTYTWQNTRIRSV